MSRTNEALEFLESFDDSIKNSSENLDSLAGTVKEGLSQLRENQVAFLEKQEAQVKDNEAVQEAEEGSSSEAVLIAKATGQTLIEEKNLGEDEECVRMEHPVEEVEIETNGAANPESEAANAEE